MSCWFVCQLVGQPVKNMRIMRNWSPNEWEDKSTLVMRISDTNSEAGVHNYRTFQVLCHQWKRTFLENLMLQLNTSLHLKMWVISCPTKIWVCCTICFVSIGGALKYEIHCNAYTITKLYRPKVKHLFITISGVCISLDKINLWHYQAAFQNLISMEIIWNKKWERMKVINMIADFSKQNINWQRTVHRI